MSAPSLFELSKAIYFDGTLIAAPLKSEKVFAPHEVFPTYQGKENLLQRVPSEHLDLIKKTYCSVGEALEVLRQSLCNPQFQDKLRFWGIPANEYSNEFWWHKRQTELGESLWRNHISYFEMTVGFPRQRLLYKMVRESNATQNHANEEAYHIDQLLAKQRTTQTWRHSDNQNLQYEISDKIEKFVKKYHNKYTDEDLQADVEQFLQMNMSYPTVVSLNDRDLSSKIQGLFAKAQGLFVLWNSSLGQERVHSFVAFKLDDKGYLYEGALAGLVVYKDLEKLGKNIDRLRKNIGEDGAVTEWKIYSLQKL
ncbi:MAG: hypothetical protein K0S74_1598 [Chlamydiales bacterium]|jgi:hypothetical protein|nr:hypothetical protein [Chlamydiales bacterium]